MASAPAAPTASAAPSSRRSPRRAGTTRANAGTRSRARTSTRRRLSGAAPSPTSKIARRDGEQEDAVQVREDGGNGRGDAEELNEKRPSRNHRNADEGVVDRRDGRNGATAHRMGFNSPWYVVVWSGVIRT